MSAFDRLVIRHLPIYGPKIHKNASAEVEQRGKANVPPLLQCYLSVYAKHLRPNQLLSAGRQGLFALMGLNLEELLSGSGSLP